MKKPLARAEVNKLKRVAEHMHESDRDYRRASNYDFFIYLLLVFFVAFCIRTFVGEPIRVDGNSMHPTLLHQERMVIEKLSYYAHPPRRGDIIVCYYPGYTVSCVKRVIGLPGDTVSIENGQVYINDAPLDESAYWNDEIYSTMVRHTVKENCVFVMGDNRNHSTDSRDPDVGDIPYEKIVGRAFLVAWPISEWRAISPQTYIAHS